MITRAVLGSLAALTWNSSALAGAADQPPTPPTAIGPVTSTNQANGVTAAYIGTVQILQPLVRGPQLERFKVSFTVGARVLRQMQRPDLTDDQIDAHTKAANYWISQTFAWLQKDVSPYAAERFAFHTPGVVSWSLGGDHKPGYFMMRTNVINIMSPLLQNLDLLMRDPSIYPQK